MRKLLPVPLVLLVTTLLSGCIAQEPHATPAPAPTSTPVFASEDEALAAAEDAYAAYIAMSDRIAADGGRDAERLGEFVTPDWLEVELSSYASFEQSGNHQVGQAHLLRSQLQSFEVRDDDTVVSIYACVDSSETRFVDADGVDVTPPSRQTLQTLEVAFTFGPAGRLSSAELWPGTSIC